MASLGVRINQRQSHSGHTPRAGILSACHHPGTRTLTRLRPISLASWLAVGSSTIVLVAVVALAHRSGILLRDFADSEGLAQAQLASSSTLDEIYGIHEDVATAARVLSGLPGLQRVIRLGDAEQIRRYVIDYCTTSGMDACALLEKGRIFAASREDVPWQEVASRFEKEGRQFVLPPGNDEPLMLGASNSALLARAELHTIALKALDGEAIAKLSEKVGHRVRISRAGHSPAVQGDRWTALHASAVAAGRVVAERVEGPRALYAASLPIPVRAPAPFACIDVELEARSMDALVTDIVRRLGVTALVIIAIAALAGVLYGHWLMRPVMALGRAAGRMGAGDLASEVPAGGVSEVAELGSNLENMRRSLVQLTESLRQRDAEARAVLGGVVEGVFAVDMQRRIRYANPQVSRLLGRPMEEIIGRFCGDVLSPVSTDGVRPCEDHCPIVQARSGAPRIEFGERLRRGDGTERSVVIVSSVPDQGRQFQVLRDETEMEAVRRARDSVLANISHEFRTPLAAQLASIEVLHDRMDELEPAERLEVIRNLERGVLRLMRLVDNLLESVRIDSGQLSIREHPVALDEVITESGTLVQPLLAQRRHRLEVSLPATLPVVHGDEQRLVQVFVNLFANAMKFAPDGSVIRVGGDAADGAVTAWVEDEGPGIPEADRDAVFHAFRRSMGGEPQAPGLGLGLWIVRSIVERHRGRIGVELTAAGRTRFIITLPTEAAA